MNSSIRLLVDTVLGKQRYWSRSYLGYPPVRDAQPNPAHYALAALQWTNHAPKLITQNVDGLHHKASSPEARYTVNDRILELHGTLHTVHCRRKHKIDRMVFQDQLSALNPPWKDFMDEMVRTKTEPRTNPDGDVRFIPSLTPSTLSSSPLALRLHVLLRRSDLISKTG
ncbi:hypothetical protein FRC12_000567 [Ceratobasidium sp. 428]|nr:hypothetical protein FRC12_000567 [Ceratobasidium sp. 428]